MAKDAKIVLDQIDLTIDMLMSQLLEVRATVTNLRKNMTEVSTPVPDNGSMLTDEHAALILTRRRQTRSKKFQ